MSPLDLTYWSLAGAAAIVVIGIAVAVAVVALARALVVVQSALDLEPDNELGQGMAAMADSLTEGAAGASSSFLRRLDSVR
ncbi:MAG: hypothetical protein ABSE70_01425 [Candidatus Limnocylindrales bacterium]